MMDDDFVFRPLSSPPNKEMAQQQQQEHLMSMGSQEMSSQSQEKTNRDPNSNDQQLANIFVAGLPVDFDEVRLRALFGVYGEILSCKIMVDIDSGISKGFGFVRFANAPDASKAIELMNGKRLSPQNPRALYVTLAQHDGTPTVVRSERVYVRNIPTQITEADLHRVFKEFGEVLECKVLRHAGSTDGSVEGPSKGVAFVRFQSIDDATNAVVRAQGTRPFAPADGSYCKPLMVRFAETHEARQQRQTRQQHHESQSASVSTTIGGPQGGTASTNGGGSTVLGSFLWEDPSTGLVYSTTVTTGTASSQGSGPPRILHQTNGSLVLPQYVMTTAAQHFSSHAPPPIQHQQQQPQQQIHQHQQQQHQQQHQQQLQQQQHRNVATHPFQPPVAHNHISMNMPNPMNMQIHPLQHHQPIISHQQHQHQHHQHQHQHITAGPYPVGQAPLITSAGPPTMMYQMDTTQHHVYPMYSQPQPQPVAGHHQGVQYMGVQPHQFYQ